MDISLQPLTSADEVVALIEEHDSGPKATRLEQRDAAADANPYLAAAAQLAAGLDGIEWQLDPGPETGGNVYESDAPPIPASLERAIDELEASRFARDALGQELVELRLHQVRAELELGHFVVTEWVRERHLQTS